jgi:hypothetical protein
MPENVQLCQHYLNEVYDDIQAKHAYPLPRDYGEILFEGTAKLLSFIQTNKQDIFVDFGSGRGKAVAQLFLQTNMQEVKGIELNFSLHQQAEAAAQRLKKELPDFFKEGRKLSFIQGDFLNYPLEGTTIALVNATCFSQQLINSLGLRLNTIKGLHTVLSSRPIATLTHFTFQYSVRIECSWDTALCYVYKNNSHAYER